MIRLSNATDSIIYVGMDNGIFWKANGFIHALSIKNRVSRK
jgi:hypothetical protein